MDLANTLLYRWGPFGAFSLGIFNCRPPSGETTGFSVHAEGRAFDLGVGAGGHELGDRVLAALLEGPDQLLQRVIWWSKTYDRETPGGRWYTGPDPHESHLHIEIPWEHADGLTSAEIAALLGETTSTEEQMPSLIVAYEGAQWIVAGDLTSRVGLGSSEDVRTLDAVGGGNLYIACTLSAGLMAKIPEVRST